MEDLEARVLAVLKGRRGKANLISMAELFEAVMGEPCADLISDTREVRRAVRSLCNRGEPLGSTCSAKNPGYWWCITPDELRQAAAPLIGRGLASLHRASRLMRLSLPTLLGQQKLEAERQAQGKLDY
jgi:hypothetical protein